MFSDPEANRIKTDFLSQLPRTDFCSLRLVEARHEMLHVRRNVLEPVETSRDRGIMVTVVSGDGAGYGATCDLSGAGIKRALEQAGKFCELSRRFPLVKYSEMDLPHPVGEFPALCRTPWDSVPLRDKIDRLRQVSESLKIDDAIVEWETMVWHIDLHSRLITSGGGDLVQNYSFVMPGITVMANQGAETQIRSMEKLMGHSRQGGYEVLDDLEMDQRGPEVAREALQLLSAPNCPGKTMDVVLDSGQMMLQVHESVGHPLELDRILGDERSYAGTSFVTPDMFGSYHYGSEHMNITFNPEIDNQLATFAYDDEGHKAEKAFLIEKGILKRCLGSGISQARSGLPGVACSRAMSWNRPPIDRMANLNLEPADATLQELIGAVEYGVYMRTNRSWSIDDSRNKFQFGCEWGRLIEEGQLGEVVKNPNYRGISANFWRNLKMVGDRSTFNVMGTPFCGKGEPNQMIRVGHATPACLFSEVEVFGGEN